jgi:hypothetical protein
MVKEIRIAKNTEQLRAIIHPPIQNLFQNSAGGAVDCLQDPRYPKTKCVRDFSP